MLLLVEHISTRIHSEKELLHDQMLKLYSVMSVGFSLSQKFTISGSFHWWAGAGAPFHTLFGQV